MVAEETLERRPGILSPVLSPPLNTLPPRTLPAHARHHPVIANRRLRYLSVQSPAYYTQHALAEALPLAYDALVRRFLTPAERQESAVREGWAARIFEDLSRAEARLRRVETQASEREDDEETRDAYSYDDQTILTLDSPPSSREEGELLWQQLTRLRFLEGRDTDADYDAVDFNADWDDLEQLSRDMQDDYFDAEEPSIDIVELHGETGVQDF
ncbi:coiled-coil domain-containing protein-domain-containing protein [Limtongia smithiae]|uniref:coiled-coil domain-containing protein-domain-containing protein n=1 Tax=Limtongia smithiae TaxID=1125753 RepID=UPI0034CE948C